MRRSIVCFRVCVAVVLVAVLGRSASADNYTGFGPDNEFSTAANWDTNAVPSVGVFSFIDGQFTVERSVNSENDRTRVRGGAVLSINGGVHVDSRSGANTYSFVGGASGSGTVNHLAGTWNVAHGLRVGGGAAASAGSYHLTGGLLRISRGSNAFLDPAPAGGRPSLEVGGVDAASAGLFEILGGAMETRGPVHVLDTGTFSVVGSGATSIGIGSIGTGDGGWFQKAGGTLRARVNARGLTPIFVDDVDDGIDNQILALFEDGSRLDLGFEDIDPVAGTWTLLEAENTAITDLGLMLTDQTAANPGWSFTVDNSGGNGLLTATFTPVIGDFDDDGDVDGDDVDFYIGNLFKPATGELAPLDLDGGGEVTIADFNLHVTTLVVTSNGVTGALLGDVNLDGEVNVLNDAFILVENLGQTVTSRSQGDLNADGVVDVLGDAFLLVSQLGQSNAQ